MHTDDLWRQAVARSAEIGANSPDLAPALALQQRMLRLLLDAVSRLNSIDFPDQGAAAVIEKWRRELPALRHVIVPIPQFLKELLPEFCSTLAEGGAGDSARHIREALTKGDIDAGSLLSVSLARNQKAIRTSALHLGLSPDLVWLVGELGSSPLAHHLQRRLLRADLKVSTTDETDGDLGSADLPPSREASADRGSLGGGGQVGPHTGVIGSADLQVGLRQWRRGYCPFCGSWPVFIELQCGSRVLRCSFCAAAWELLSHRCIYCGNAGADFLAAAPDLSRKNRQVDLCGACGNYTKVIEVGKPTPFPLLAIEDLATRDLDVGAMSREYRRPELYELESTI
jgi:formate dehydrogenase formation protein